ncbi:hypothetical protein PENARI_c015G09961 [Penicillium arizonense]|uniref:Major facilitator superfamily (MFS) profile domain-containing protein n=1 Tax=Penicillium arizonense TaxID=1835702 RepID=A0A1F5LCH9_PENAI|nr:hypothetical protein PENARI_c015G09961 [Penicillium arizonense]OGE50797.1 hypothetical protein PENARI_c015G09961 [Penicillium arizonense]
MLGPICVTFSIATTSSEKLRVSEEVMILVTGLFMLGFAFGPIIFGPLSELYGRKRPMFLGMFVFAIFHVPVAVARNLQAIFIFRFLGGVLASAPPLAIVSGIVTDIFEPVERGIAISIFAASSFVGPVAGPITGSFITLLSGWRWTEYITATWAFAFSIIGFLTIPETFKVTFLTQRAKCQRTKTKNWAFHAKRRRALLEPILLLLTLHVGFIYVFLYICFEAYPISFQYDRGWQEGVAALAFVAIICGVAVACLIIVIFSLTRYRSIFCRTG